MAFPYTVLQIIPALEEGGAERTTVEIAAAIAQAGGRALVASRGGRLAGEIEAAGGKVFPMPVHSKNPFVMAANAGRLRDLIAGERADIAHVRSRAPAWSALWAARRARVPLIATYHGAYSAGSPVKRFYNSAMIRGDLVIANSEFTAAAIRAAYALDAARLRVIPRGADLSRFDPDRVAPERVAALFERWGGAGAFRLLLPARLTPWKGQSLAVEAVARLAEKRRASGQAQPLRLVLAGDPQDRSDYANRLAGEIESRGVRDMVQLVGHCADMPAAYAWSDAVIAPSLRPEAFGRVAVEAAAMRRPAIAADHGGARETVLHGETGFLTPPGDAQALSCALARVLDMSAPARAAMGAKAAQRARALFSVEAMAQATLGAYREVLAARGGRG